MDHLDDVREGVDDLGKKEFMSVRRSVALSLPFVAHLSTRPRFLFTSTFILDFKCARAHTHTFFGDYALDSISRLTNPRRSNRYSHTEPRSWPPVPAPRPNLSDPDNEYRAAY